MGHGDGDAPSRFGGKGLGREREREMLARESSSSNFDLPEEVLQVLPPDPFEQLDVARKITSIALATRVSSLESEADALRAQLADKDYVMADLQAKVESLDASLSDTANKLALAEQEKEELLKEKSYLSNTVRKLNRDVSKVPVDVFLLRKQAFENALLAKDMAFLATHGFDEVLQAEATSIEGFDGVSAESLPLGSIPKLSLLVVCEEREVVVVLRVSLRHSIISERRRRRRRRGLKGFGDSESL